LRYLCLLAILLHPEPPPFIVIEEPELGLHPDVLPHIAELLQQAAKRTQIVVNQNWGPFGSPHSWDENGREARDNEESR
jgi:predicted ATPase